MKPEVAEFTTEQPVTKLELWNCFRGQRGFRRRQIDDAKSIIGANAPRYLKSKGYVRQYEHQNVEYYELTEAGRVWLTEGFKRFLKRHPDKRTEARYVPRSF